MIYPASLLCDFYKISHREQYPPKTEKIYSTWTPRTSRIKGIDSVVAFGFQAFIQQYLINYFDANFFEREEEDVFDEYRRVIRATLGINSPDASHIQALHKLGYLPLRIRAVKEGTRVPIRVPMLTIENTKPEFFWLTNYIETLMSMSLWQASTSATIAAEYKKILTKWAEKTATNTSFVQFQGHDFSMRGMSSLESAKISGAGHLLSFVGTDTIPAILFLEEFYGANIEKELVGTSIPATEHSVMSAYGQDELSSYKRLLTEVYPKGFFSVVSDTWDLWKVLSDVVRPLKREILARDGKVVIRPDSGDPVKIICGDVNGKTNAEKMGVVGLLWEIFGGKLNEKGFKELDPHIGVIYGDAITLERCEMICEQLAEQGFASTNMVYGIGSYTYQYNTRDTFGFALKSTYAKINGEEKFLFKNPVTDSGIKKSQTGMVVVKRKTLKPKPSDEIICVEGLNEEQRSALLNEDLMDDVFIDGEMLRFQNLHDIRYSCSIMILFNEQEVKIHKFPNGESLIDKEFFTKFELEKNVLTLSYESDAELFQLYLIKKALWFLVSLRITYMPYSRMDRASNEYLFTLKYFAEFINSLNFEHVYIYEPHSDVTMTLIERSIPISLIRQLLRKTDYNNSSDCILFPDSGAYKHYSHLLQPGTELTGYKKRDFKTGRITNLAINNIEEAKGRRVFIVDDLCSKGGTFLMAAEKLKEAGATEINLVVAHCEESIFDGKIFSTDLIKHIYTTDSIKKEFVTNRLTMFPLATL
jgi:nicotinamide phosphoribosyltransferase